MYIYYYIIVKLYFPENHQIYKSINKFKELINNVFVPNYENPKENRKSNNATSLLDELIEFNKSIIEKDTNNYFHNNPQSEKNTLEKITDKISNNKYNYVDEYWKELMKMFDTSLLDQSIPYPDKLNIVELKKYCYENIILYKITGVESLDITPNPHFENENNMMLRSGPRIRKRINYEEDDDDDIEDEIIYSDNNDDDDSSEDENFGESRRSSKRNNKRRKR